MSEFYGDSISPFPTTTNDKPMAAVIKQSVTYMSCSGPGSSRSFEIPTYDLEISEKWNIDSFKSNKIRNKKYGLYLSNPNQVFELEETHIADLDALVAAKRTFEAAMATYEAAQAAFRKSNTGKWIDDLLVPDKPLPETLEARISHGEIKKLTDLVKSHSINPDEETITIIPTFSGYNDVTIDLNLKIGINRLEFRKLYSKLENYSGSTSNKNRVHTIKISYKGDYPPYRKTDLIEVKENDKKVKELICTKENCNTTKDDFIIPKIISKDTSEEDHARYMEEQMRVLQSV
jgi:hypothetical protein